MNTFSEKSKENNCKAAACTVADRQNKTNPTGQLKDNRPETIAQRNLQAMADNSLIQRKFQGAPPSANNPVNVAYPGHAFNAGGTRGNTGCGTNNSVCTAGEHKNGGESDPGTPANMNNYKFNFSRLGGLVRDPALNQTSTQIHLINHRFEDSGNTQGVASNILLGSKRANNPTHLHQVENPVLKSLRYGSQQNAAYENSMQQAQTLNDADNGGTVTYWPYPGPPPAVIPQKRITGCWLDLNGDVTYQPPAKKAKKANPFDGYFIDCSNPKFLPKHLWLEYRVTANYGGAPGFVTNNVTHERNQNGGNVNPTNQALENHMQAFEGNWKDDAFPTDFTSNATYYLASFIPATPYHQVQENAETIPTDK